MVTNDQQEQPIGSSSQRIWVDSHCHLDMLKASAKSEAQGLTQPQIAQQALDQARERGVGHFLCVCVDLAKYERMLGCVALDERVAHSAGIHPSTDEPRTEQQWSEQLRELLKDESVVAVGETGLDYHYDSIPRSEQRARFATHIALAREYQRPLIIHTRDAREDTFSLMRSEGGGDVVGVMHCFTESWEMARAALDLGFYISFSGIVTFKNAQSLREVAVKVPLDRVLIETDSPYLAPVPFRGRQNTPAFVPWVGLALAELRQQTPEAIAHQTTENYFSLFKKAKRF